ncbi:glycine-rich domain-containing protein [Actinomadura litoris]|uniref:glycine-rich domain-containing protein n=1 Tax=Actinomadura litoris TaxID=2678616 RepID=UPI001FA70C5D|nr:hypothetical protein [Actinomadura litoris]
MTVSCEAVSADERWRRIDHLDLEPMVSQLIGDEDKPMSLAEADHAVGLYRAFLKLCVRFGDTEPIAPNKAIDAVWHAHMSDTAKYRADCDYVAGRFLDHWPYAGTMGPDDERRLQETFSRTCDLMMDHFAINLRSTEHADCDLNDCAQCGFTKVVAVDRPRPRPDRSITA